MNNHWTYAWVLVLPLLATAPFGDQGVQNPLRNDDVITMVRGGVPEGTVIRALQSSVADLDVSPAALIALSDAGVGERILDAMIAAANRKPGAAAGSRATSQTGPAFSTRGQPVVTLVLAGSRAVVPFERTRLVQTAARPTSLAALSTDKLMDEAFRSGVSAARRSTGRIGGVAAGQAAGALAGLIGGDGGKTSTYVWALPKLASPTRLATDSPVFELDLNGATGIAVDDFVPVIVALTPTANGFRLVGATEGRTGVTTGSGIDWPVYSAFVEDRLDGQAVPISAGHWRVSPTVPLAPGEYGVVLRPVDKSKRFSGAQIARSQGDGLAFSRVWSFCVP